MDWAQAAASNINATIGAGASVLSDLFGYWNTNNTNELNREIAERNNQIAIQLARENNSWQASMLGAQQQFSSQEAEKAYRRELEKMRLEWQYNSPLEQVKRLREAGLNPALAFGGHNIGSAAGVSAPQAGNVSSGVTPSMPVLTTPHMESFRFSSPTAAMRDIGEAMAAMATARRTGVDTEVAEKTMDDVIRSVKADADMKEIAATLESEFGRGDRTRSQKMADQKIAESVQTVKNLVKSGEYTDALTAVQKVEKLIKDNELDQANIQLKYLPEQLRAYIDGIKATASRDRSQAALNRELGITEDKLRDIRGKLLGSQKDQADAAAKELSNLASKFAAENGMLPNQMHWQEIQDMYLQQIREDLKSKEFDNTWTGRMMRMMLGPAATVGGAALGAGARILVAP